MRFFGRTAVLGGNEAVLYRTLDAHEITNASDQELLDKMNRVPDLLSDRLESFPPEERPEIAEESRFTIADIAAMKKEAQEHLRGIM